MTHRHEERHGDDTAWADLGRAAEHFARRIARDAGTFAERLEEHANEFAHDVSHDWRRWQRRHRRLHHAAAGDVQRVFEDVRTLLADVLEGVDELIGRVFTTHESDQSWIRVISNRAAACAACGRNVDAGETVYVHRGAAAAGVEYRCSECGVPADEQPAS